MAALTQTVHLCSVYHHKFMLTMNEQIIRKEGMEKIISNYDALLNLCGKMSS